MKKYLPLLLTFLPLISYSQDVIYKCTSAKGEINYINLSSAANKNSGCVKTDIAGVDRAIIRNSDNKKSNSGSSGTSGTVAVYSEDQKNRDSKRQTILQKELEEEQNQLTTVNTSIATLNNSKGVDPKQIQDLNNLLGIHKKNIEALKKELGIKDSTNTVNVTPLKIEKVNSTVASNEKSSALTK